MNPALLAKLAQAARGTKAAKVAGRAGRGGYAALKAGLGRGMDPRLRMLTPGADEGAMVLGRRGLLGAMAGVDQKLGAAGEAMGLPGWATKLGAAAGAVGTADLGLWAADALTGDGSLDETELRKMMIMQAYRERKAKMAMMPYGEAVHANKQAMALQDPTLMKSVLAGEPLNPGEEVLGGTPHTDILDQLALAMSQGKFIPTDPLDSLEL